MDYMLNNLPGFVNMELFKWDVSKVTTHTGFSMGWGPGNTEPTWK
jgi:hypothetical protein